MTEDRSEWVADSICRRYPEYTEDDSTRRSAGDGDGDGDDALFREVWAAGPLLPL